MNADRTALFTGGCQCGAVRYAIYANPSRIGVCHCRMCQKAVGVPLIALADISHLDFAWTEGQPASFRSSNIAERDFCADCGTPLSYRQIGGPNIELTTGSFDRPDLVTPTFATCIESMLLWTGDIARLKARDIGATAEPIVSHQHPDRVSQ